MSLEGAPENDAQNESTFSVASMFGAFLTLSTCLLLQPQGSLTIKRPSVVAGRVLFFFFRLNPMLCAAEATGALQALVLILWRAIMSCPDNQFPEFAVFSANLQAGAAGLLLLRSHTAYAQLDQRLIESAPKRGHTMVVLDAITMISVVYTAVKLGASVTPWYFQLIAWTYMVDWFLVQLAVMISHFGSSMEQLDSEELLRSAEYLQQKVRVLEFGRLLGGIAFILLMLSFGDPHPRMPHLIVMSMQTFAFAILVPGPWSHGLLLEYYREATVSMMFFGSLMGTIFMWGTGFSTYEEEGTFKPEWLDWLG